MSRFARDCPAFNWLFMRSANWDVVPHSECTSSIPQMSANILVLSVGEQRLLSWLMTGPGSGPCVTFKSVKITWEIFLYRQKAMIQRKPGVILIPCETTMSVMGRIEFFVFKKSEEPTRPDVMGRVEPRALWFSVFFSFPFSYFILLIMLL